MIKNNGKKSLIKKGLSSYDESIEVICGPIEYHDLQNPNLKFNDEPDSVFLKDLSFSHEKDRIALLAISSNRSLPSAISWKARLIVSNFSSDSFNSKLNN